MKIPKIGSPQEHDFHDSILEDIKISNRLDEIVIIVSTPQGNNRFSWKVKFSEILRFEYETTGIGVKQKQPIDIYDIYNLINSEEKNRWKERFELKEIDVNNIFHIELASSLYRGWGKNKDLDGINIICKSVSIEPL